MSSNRSNESSIKAGRLSHVVCYRSRGARDNSDDKLSLGFVSDGHDTVLTSLSVVHTRFTL